METRFEKLLKQQRVRDAISIDAHDATVPEWAKRSAYETLSNHTITENGADIGALLDKWQSVYKTGSLEPLMDDMQRGWASATKQGRDAQLAFMKAHPVSQAEKARKEAFTYVPGIDMEYGGVALPLAVARNGGDPVIPDQFLKAKEELDAGMIDWASANLETQERQIENADNAAIEAFSAQMQRRNSELLFAQIEPSLIPAAKRIVQNYIASDFVFDDDDFEALRSLPTEQKQYVTALATAVKPETTNLILAMGESLADAAWNVTGRALDEFGRGVLTQAGGFVGGLLATGSMGEAASLSKREYNDWKEARAFRKEMLAPKFADFGVLGNSLVDAAGIVGFWAPSFISMGAGRAGAALSAAGKCEAVASALGTVGANAEKISFAAYAVQEREQMLDRIAMDGGDPGSLWAQTMSTAGAVAHAAIENIAWQQFSGGNRLRTDRLKADAYAKIVHAVPGKVGRWFSKDVVMTRGAEEMAASMAAKIVGKDIAVLTFFESMEEGLQQAIEETVVGMVGPQGLSVEDVLGESWRAFYGTMLPMMLTMGLGGRSRAQNASKAAFPIGNTEFSRAIDAATYLRDAVARGEVGTGEARDSAADLARLYGEWAQAANPDARELFFARLGANQRQREQVNALFSEISKAMTPAQLVATFGESMAPRGTGAILQRDKRMQGLAVSVDESTGEETISREVTLPNGEKIDLVVSANRQQGEVADLSFAKNGWSSISEWARMHPEALKAAKDAGLDFSLSFEDAVSQARQSGDEAERELKNKFEKFVANFKLDIRGLTSPVSVSVDPKTGKKTAKASIRLTNAASEDTAYHEYAHAMQGALQEAGNLAEDEARALARDLGTPLQGDENWNQERGSVEAEGLSGRAAPAEKGIFRKILEWAGLRERLQEKAPEIKTALDSLMAAMYTGRWEGLGERGRVLLDAGQTASASEENGKQAETETEAKEAQGESADAEQEAKGAEAPRPAQNVAGESGKKGEGGEQTTLDGLLLKFNAGAPMTLGEMSRLWDHVRAGSREQDALRTETLRFLRGGWRYNPANGMWSVVDGLIGKEVSLGDHFFGIDGHWHGEKVSGESEDAAHIPDPDPVQEKIDSAFERVHAMMEEGLSEADALRAVLAEVRRDQPKTKAAKERKQRVRRALSDALREAEAREELEARGGGSRFQLVGRRADGIEVYETDPAIRALPYKDRAAKFRDMMRDVYRHRTARFVKNGTPYYARFDKVGVKKNTNGDNQSSDAGREAKMNVAASGDVFDLVEETRFDKEKPETGKTGVAHAGVQAWDYFGKTVQIDGEVFDILVNVRDTGDNQWVYNIALRENPNVKPDAVAMPNEGRSPNPAQQGGSQPSSVPEVKSENPGRLAVRPTRPSPEFAMDGTVVDALPAHLREDARAIVAERADTPLWMTDPDGTPTDLSERDWLRREAEARHNAPRFAISGLYTGSAADYANRVPVLDKDGKQTGWRIVNGPSLLHIGSGEGSQVYGWGLYASGVRGVAETYAQEATGDPRVIARNFLAHFGGDREKAIVEIKKGLKIGVGLRPETAESAKKAIRLLRSGKAIPENIGNIYEQTFFTNRATPEETERHLLSWYGKPTAEQKEWIAKALVDTADPARLAAFPWLEAIASREMGAEIYDDLQRLLGSPRAASEFLARAGIDGVKYPVDSYGGKGVKDGDAAGWNYVSFRDDNIRVDHKWTDGVRRYSLAPAGRQKQAGTAYPDAGDEIRRFSIGAKRAGEYRALLARRRPDLDAGAVLAELEKFNDPKREKIALHWVVRGTLALPQDAYKVEDALSVADKARVDPFRYEGPDALLLAHKEFKPAARPIDPATVPELSDPRDEGGGIVSYLVQDDRAGQAAMRRIIDTHWGEDANPWCLLARTGGGDTPTEAFHAWLSRKFPGRPMTSDEVRRVAPDYERETGAAAYDHEAPALRDEDAWFYWNHYSALPKRVAFKDGKLLAFMATEFGSSVEVSLEDRLEELRESMYGQMSDLDDTGASDRILDAKERIDNLVSSKQAVSARRLDSYAYDNATIREVAEEYGNDDEKSAVRRIDDYDTYDDVTEDDCSLLQSLITKSIQGEKDKINHEEDEWREWVDSEGIVPSYDIEDNTATIVDGNGEAADFADGEPIVYRRRADGSYVSGGEATEEWWDRQDTSHPNLDWARGARFSIGRIAGRNVAIVEAEPLTTAEAQDEARVREVLSGVIGKQFPQLGQPVPVKVDRKFADEFWGSNTSQKLRDKLDKMWRAKVSAVPILGDILQATPLGPAEAASHINANFKDRAVFYRCPAEFGIKRWDGIAIYPCDLLILEMKNSGTRYVYDLVKMAKPTLAAKSSLDSDLVQRLYGQTNHTVESATPDIQPQTGGEVKSEDNDSRLSVQSALPIFDAGVIPDNLRWGGISGFEGNVVGMVAMCDMVGRKVSDDMIGELSRRLGVNKPAKEIRAAAKSLQAQDVARLAMRKAADGDVSGAVSDLATAASGEDLKELLKAAVNTGAKRGVAADKMRSKITAAILAAQRGANLADLVREYGFDPARILHSWERQRKRKQVPTPEEKAAMDAAKALADALSGQDIPTALEDPDGTKAQAAEARIAEARDKAATLAQALMAAMRDLQKAREEHEAKRAAKEKPEAKPDAPSENDDGEEDEETGQAAAPDALPLPWELLAQSGLDIRDAKTFALVLRVGVRDMIWRADSVNDRPFGEGLEGEALRKAEERFWKNPTALDQYRKSMVTVMLDLANKLLDHDGRAFRHVREEALDIQNDNSANAIERSVAGVLRQISASSIRETTRALVKDVQDTLRRDFVDKNETTLTHDILRKITGETQKRAKWTSRVLSMTERQVEEAREKLQNELEQRAELYDEAMDAEGATSTDVTADQRYREALWKLADLDAYAGTRDLLPGEAKERCDAIKSWFDGEANAWAKTIVANERRMEQARETILAAVANKRADGSDIVHEKDRYSDKRYLRWVNTLDQRFRDIFRFAKDKEATAAALWREELSMKVARATEIYETRMKRYRKAFETAVASIVGAKGAAAWIDRMQEDIGEEAASKLSKTGRRTMTYGQALHLYGYLLQVGDYGDNIARHGRQGQREILEREVLSREDLAIFAKLREIYAASRDEISEAKKAQTGIGFGVPDPFYAPVKVKTPTRSGAPVSASTWNLMPEVFSERRKHALDVDETANALVLFWDRAEQSSRMIAYGELGVEFLQTVCDGKVKEAIERYHGKKTLTALLNHIGDVLNGSHSVPGAYKGDEAKLLNEMRSAVTTIALCGNLAPSLNQTVSAPVFLFARERGFGSLLRDMAKIGSAEWKQALQEWSESDPHKVRYGEGGIMGEVKDALLGGNGVYSTWKRLLSLGFTPLQIGDRLPSILVGVAVYMDERDALVKRGMDYESAKRQAATKAFIHTETTQQSSRVENQPELTRRGDAGTRLFTMFMSSPMLQLSWQSQRAREMRAAVDPEGKHDLLWCLANAGANERGRHARKKFIEAVVVNHLYMPAAMGLMSLLFNALLGDEPDEKDAAALLAGMALGPFGAVIGAAYTINLIVGLATQGKGYLYGSGTSTAPSSFSTMDRLISKGLVSAYDLATFDLDAALKDADGFAQSLVSPYRHVRKAIDNYGSAR